MTLYEDGSKFGYEVGTDYEGCRHCCAPRFYGSDYCRTCEVTHDNARPLWSPCYHCDGVLLRMKMSAVDAQGEQG